MTLAATTLPGFRQAGNTPEHHGYRALAQRRRASASPPDSCPPTNRGRADDCPLPRASPERHPWARSWTRPSPTESTIRLFLRVGPPTTIDSRHVHARPPTWVPVGVGANSAAGRGMTNPLRFRLPRGARPHAVLAATALSVSSAAGCTSTSGADEADLYVDPMPEGRDTATIEASGSESDPDAGIDLGDIPLTVEKVTSSRVELSWTIEGATEIRLFVGPEPKGDRDTLPVEHEIARLDGAARSHVIEGIAA